MIKIPFEPEAYSDMTRRNTREGLLINQDFVYLRDLCGYEFKTL
jgi:hypothetical protein